MVKLKNAVVVISTLKGQDAKEFKDFSSAESFMSQVERENDCLENYKDQEQWYIETKDNGGYELRYLAYTD